MRTTPLIPSMPFPINRKEPAAVRPETFAVCLVLTCSLQIMENLLPKIPIFPWLRLGLAYWVLLPFLIRFGVRQALLLFLFRNLITLIYGGQIFSSFLISTSAGLLSLSVFGTVGRLFLIRNKIGLIGLSVLLACSFNINQLVIVDFLLIRHRDFYFQLAPILFWSAVSGSLIAALVYKSRHVLDRLFSKSYSLSKSVAELNEASLKSSEKLSAAVSMIVFCSLFFFNNWKIQAIYLVVLVVVTRFKNIRLLKHSWPFYFYIAWLHLFRTEGVYVFREWITAEGLDSFLYYAFRTTNIIVCGQWFARYVPALLKSIKTNRFLEGTGFALPVLPAIFGLSIAMGKELLQKVKSREFNELLDPIIERLLEEFKEIERRRNH